MGLVISTNLAGSSGESKRVDSGEPIVEAVPTGAVLVHHPSLALRASYGWQARSICHPAGLTFRRRMMLSVAGAAAKEDSDNRTDFR